uniref:Uncharacterized protein n=1 Tax=Arundo donax TaxID=35708 RepID=A0A0A9AGL7_ARUDO
MEMQARVATLSVTTTEPDMGVPVHPRSWPRPPAGGSRPGFSWGPGSSSRTRLSTRGPAWRCSSGVA